MISANWPFKPNKAPFYYGWVIVFASTLGIICSIPGQTMGLAVFTDSFISVLGLTRTELSLAYLIGTVASSFCLSEAGRYFDLWGGRVMITIASVSLSLMLIYISFLDLVSTFLGGSSLLCFILITIGYFGVRLFGQGVLTNCSRNVLLFWFTRRRGLVTGIRNVFVTIGFSIAPMIIGGMIGLYGWRGALWIFAMSIGAGFSLLSFLLIRDNPESCGLKADGIENCATEYPIPDTGSRTLEQAKHSPIFWIYSISLSANALLVTAVVFHVLSIFHEAGRTSAEAFGYFLPAAIVSTTTNVVASWLTDKIILKPILLVMLASLFAGCFGFIYLETNWGFWLLVSGFGVSSGLWSVLQNHTFIRFFGSDHLGQISGFSSSINVFASAVGPMVFSLGFDFFGSYSSPVQFCTIAIAFILIAAILLQQREPREKMSQSGKDSK